MLAKIWWTLVAIVSAWMVLFVLGPPSVQAWQVDAISSVLQKLGL